MRDPSAEILADPASGVLARAGRLGELDAQLRRALPAPLSDHVLLADVRDDGCLVFLADHPVWAARLRAEQGSLLSAARAAGTAAERMTVKVAPLPAVPRGATSGIPLSAAARAHLREAARSLEDPELRAIFLRLADLA
ncbi:MAG: DciA family protein [Xanthomonadales bacterium]|nr:DciA family protein [Xanthomonadales bacterium]